MQLCTSEDQLCIDRKLGNELNGNRFSRCYRAKDSNIEDHVRERTIRSGRRLDRYWLLRETML